MAEELWDGDTWHMAAELNVTMQVLADYQPCSTSHLTDESPLAIPKKRFSMRKKIIANHSCDASPGDGL